MTSIIIILYLNKVLIIERVRRKKTKHVQTKLCIELNLFGIVVLA